MAALNAALPTSQVNIVAKVAYKGLYNHPFNGTYYSDFSAFRTNSAVNAILQSNNADVAVLLMDYMQGDWITIDGVASVNAIPGSRHAIVKIQQATGIRQVFAHEVGHFFGAHHHPEDLGLAFPSPVWARGHKFIYTIGDSTYYGSTNMAYSHYEIGSNIAPSIKRFSNPNVTWKPFPSYITPIPTGTGNHNNALRMNQRAEYVTTLGGMDLYSSINGNVNAYTGQGNLTAFACGGTGGYSYEWRWSNPPGSTPILVSTSSTLPFTFWPGDNLVTLKVSSGSLQSQTSRYYYVMTTPPSIVEESGPATYTEMESEGITGIDGIYPNPFNPVTQINITLTESGEVDLNLFDLLGRKVSTIYKGELNQGTHRFSFNGVSLSSGTYILQLKTGDQLYTRNMVLMK